MNIIKPGRPMVVPTVRTTCPWCEAELEYDQTDIIVNPAFIAGYGDFRCYVNCPCCRQAIKDAKLVEEVSSPAVL
jgi:hypothetical protein